MLASRQSWDPHRRASREILNSRTTCQWYSSVRVFILFWSKHSETNLWEVLPAHWQNETASVNFHRVQHTCQTRAQKSRSTIFYGIQKSLSFIRWVQEATSEKTSLYLIWKRCILKPRIAYTLTNINPPSSTTTSSCWPSTFLVI